MDLHKRLSASFLQKHPAEAARLLEGMSGQQAAAVLGAVPTQAAAASVGVMEPYSAAGTLGLLPAYTAAGIAGQLPVDTAAGILRRMDETSRDALLQEVPSAAAEPLRRLLAHAEESAGALMDPLVLTVPEDLTAGEALARIRKEPKHATYYIYVLNREQGLSGVVTLRRLMLARPGEPVSSIMRTDVARVPAAAGHDVIKRHPAWRSVHALPVVDREGRFLGAIRYETLRRLEDAGRSAAHGSGAFSAAMTLGELTWIGMMHVLGGIVAPIASGGRTDPRKEKP
jgi:magnesium transporter